MPIYMKVEGIKGNVDSHYSGGGPRINVYNGSENSSGSGGILVSRISIPNSPSDAIDALAPNTVIKARALFEAQRSKVTSLGVVFSIPARGANKLRHTNNLRQISLAAHGQVSTIRLFITDGSNQTGVAVELENCLITSYSVSGHGGSTQAAALFKASLIGEGKKVQIAFVKTN